MSVTNPAGLCMCGCGLPAPLAPSNDAKRGYTRGEPMRYIAGHARSRPLWQRIAEKCEPGADGCLLWTGAATPLGYGQLYVDGRLQFAHRAAYELTHGAIAEGMSLDHLCRRPSCIAPGHLQVVTHQENVRRGLSTKLTDQHVREICESREPLRVLADRYGIHPNYVSALRNGRHRAAEVVGAAA